MRRIELLAGVVLICLCASAAQAQNNNFFNRGGVGLFNPIIDVVNTGNSLVVQPTVSADRKYVTLTGRYQNAQLVRIENFQFFGIANQGGPVGGAGGGAQQGQQPGGGGQIQLPVMQVIGLDINASAPVEIRKPGPGPVLRQQGMFLISPP
ncbi:MAG TPA: hypothetical protein VGQ99_16950 [Tepidisphaeraceae bacterium]|jgi:hypothetical protein|nr:hypothetical protein [Tepidisphaeraceae bacterium]